MLTKDPKSMGRGVRRMPFRKALKRDVWDPSEQAVAIGEQWNDFRRKGAKVSFAKDTETEKKSQEP